MSLYGVEPKLELVDLAGTQVTDDGIKHLASIATLREINLCGTQISDDGLRCLSTLARLEWVDASFTCVTEETAAEMEAAAPALSVLR